MEETGRDPRDAGKKRRRMPSPTMILSMLALFVALGGTATALQGKFSVKRNDIAPRAVDAGKIKLGAVNGNHIADKAVGAWKLRLNSTASAPSEACLLYTSRCV